MHTFAGREGVEPSLAIPVTPGVKPGPASVSRPCDGCLPCHLRIAFIGQQYIEEVSTMP